MTGKKAGQQGFSLIEVVVVLAIIGLLAGIALTTYFTTIDRVRLSGDVRNVSQTLQEARMRAISSGIPHGVAFIRGDHPGYFIFVDCDGTSFNYRYVDSDSDPNNNGELQGWDDCAADLGSDPLVVGGNIDKLGEGISFDEIFGDDSLSPNYVVFNHLGQAVRDTELSLASGRIMLRNHHAQSTDYDISGVEVLGATGMTEIITIGTISP